MFLCGSLVESQPDVTETFQFTSWIVSAGDLLNKDFHVIMLAISEFAMFGSRLCPRLDVSESGFRQDDGCLLFVISYAQAVCDVKWHGLDLIYVML